MRKRSQNQNHQFNEMKEQLLESTYQTNNMWPTQQDFRSLKLSAMLAVGIFVMYVGVNWILNDDDDDEEDDYQNSNKNSKNSKNIQSDNKGFFDHISHDECNQNSKDDSHQQHDINNKSVKIDGMGKKVPSRSCLRKNVSMPNLSASDKDQAHHETCRGIHFSKTASIVKIGMFYKVTNVFCHFLNILIFKYLEELISPLFILIVLFLFLNDFLYNRIVFASLKNQNVF